MNSDPIEPQLVKRLDQLCRRCPRGGHTPKCPFGVFGTLSEGSRRPLLAGLNHTQLGQLFDLATDCPSCPEDQRRDGTGKAGCDASRAESPGAARH